MLLSPRKSDLASLFKEVRVFKGVENENLGDSASPRPETLFGSSKLTGGKLGGRFLRKTCCQIIVAFELLLRSTPENPSKNLSPQIGNLLQANPVRFPSERCVIA